MSENRKQLIKRALLDKCGTNTEVYFSDDILTVANINKLEAMKLMEQHKNSVTEFVNKLTNT